MRAGDSDPRAAVGSPPAGRHTGNVDGARAQREGALDGFESRTNGRNVPHNLRRERRAARARAPLELLEQLGQELDRFLAGQPLPPGVRAAPDLRTDNFLASLPWPIYLLANASAFLPALRVSDGRSLENCSRCVDRERPGKDDRVHLSACTAGFRSPSARGRSLHVARRRTDP